ncbi:hypothetical protein CLAFUW4_00930 [Fulvia fulva]|uniref:Uncharacterized protein n=1 Tax=Passalora fulva TaxID=5499 RepID=A0A9Q8P360_PASFU|nr:uncharacterized protein CLAFUR5_00936 [Fulvia fulva]KAK4635927.1 hypothetical protein CLAFUR4_00931 [Fulvia fulva]KAK4637380.1 hypothetical protein CLAFUR0_00932 [Fulvia fulva]UJO11593.1 hypothetical protein CLAFUR5_00936 [Fulvia fulva]WPV08692.1 hypothetical protein CLAFUW4_00930 [Fulvia fulva]WPV23240.1 hypothetical protein CLAFUW7_00886 [Fulvia fulva]
MWKVERGAARDGAYVSTSSAPQSTTSAPCLLKYLHLSLSSASRLEAIVVAFTSSTVPAHSYRGQYVFATPLNDSSLTSKCTANEINQSLVILANVSLAKGLCAPAEFSPKRNGTVAACFWLPALKTCFHAGTPAFVKDSASCRVPQLTKASAKIADVLAKADG